MSDWESIDPKNTEPEPPERPFNVAAFFFAPFYYIGYGQYIRGALFLMVSLVPMLALGVSLYAGFRADKELPVGQRPFDWRAVMIAMIGFTFLMFSMQPKLRDPFTSEPLVPQTSSQSLQPGFSPENYCRRLGPAARKTCMNMEQKARQSLIGIKLDPIQKAVCQGYAQGSNVLLLACLRNQSLPQL